VPLLSPHPLVVYDVEEEVLFLNARRGGGNSRLDTWGANRGANTH
jgi:hypothetical protein